MEIVNIPDFKDIQNEEYCACMYEWVRLSGDLQGRLHNSIDGVSDAWYGRIYVKFMNERKEEGNIDFWRYLA